MLNVDSTTGRKKYTCTIICTSSVKGERKVCDKLAYVINNKRICNFARNVFVFLLRTYPSLTSEETYFDVAICYWRFNLHAFGD